MPRYRIVTMATFINSHLHDVGAEIEYAGWPGSTLDPVDDVATRIKAYYATRRRDRKLPRAPDLAEFAEAPPPAEDQSRRRRVKDDANG